LRDTLLNGFPKEAAFQHLFNETLSQHLPVEHAIIPELNTYAKDASGKVRTGELDFYVNGKLKWALELVRNGSKIGEHIARFDEKNGKYRKVDMSDYLVVDCRPVYKGDSDDEHESRCSLYFAEDFTFCMCKMRKEKDLFWIDLEK